MKQAITIIAIAGFTLLAGCSTATHSDIKSTSLISMESSNTEMRQQNSQLKHDIATTERELARLRLLAQETAAAKAPPVYAAPAAPVSVPTDKLWVRINFKSGHSTILPQTRRTLSNIAAKFLANPGNMRLAVLGYSDDEPVGGYKRSHRPVHNYKNLNDLSQARADAVARVMIDAGIPAYKVQATGMGATDFIADNSTKDGRSKNRRVEIHLISD